MDERINKLLQNAVFSCPHHNGRKPGQQAATKEESFNC